MHHELRDAVCSDPPGDRIGVQVVVLLDSRSIAQDHLKAGTQPPERLQQDYTRAGSRKEASTNSFRRMLGELSTLMAYELTRDMPLQEIEIETPLETTTGKVIDGKKLVLVSILRAGNGFLDGMLNVVPGSRIGHIGLFRDPQTLQPVEYYYKMPENMCERDAIVVDPMLATGNSAAAAVSHLKNRSQPKSIKFMCLLAAPEGIATLQAAHPDVDIYTAAIDRQLDDHGYILPGLGDAGDRIFGTK